MGNAGLDDSQAGIKVAVRNINKLRCADHTTLTAETEGELKNLLMQVKEESEKAGLKVNIQKYKRERERVVSGRQAPWMDVRDPLEGGWQLNWGWIWTRADVADMGKSRCIRYFQSKMDRTQQQCWLEVKEREL